jgi:hypothetical protein
MAASFLIFKIQGPPANLAIFKCCNGMFWISWYSYIYKEVHTLAFAEISESAVLKHNLLTCSTEQSPSWEANQFAASQEISRIFMEPEGSLPHSQVPATCPDPEPTPSSSHNHLQLPEDPSYYYPPIYVWVSPMASFPLAFTPTPCAHLSPAHKRHIPRPSHSSRFYHPHNIG